MPSRDDMLVIIGAATIIGGVWLLSQPAALIVAGILVILFVLLLPRRSG